MKKEKTTQLLSLLAGIVFLVSGIGKSLAAFQFSQLLVLYGFEFLQFLAPIIIVIEIIIGMLLFFNIKLKQTSLIALCFTAVLSIVYLYGFFFINISDCGCFGHFSVLNMSPFFTVLRNLVLIGILLYVFLKSADSNKKPDKNEMIIMVCILCAVCFVAGYTFNEKENVATQYITKGKNINIDVKNSVLGELMTFSEDSTYFVFIFSYSCQHCLNSIENLKQYERFGVADKVIALSYKTDSVTMQKFKEIFNVNFEIINYPPEQFFRLNNKFPVSYYVENNIIKMEIHGLLPSGLNSLQNHIHLLLHHSNN